MKKYNYNFNLCFAVFAYVLIFGSVLFAQEQILNSVSPAAETSTNIDSSEYVNQAWAQEGKRNFAEVYRLTQECIVKFSSEADRLSANMSALAPKGDENKYKILNDVAVCYFIQGEAQYREGKIDDSIKTMEIIIAKYPYAQAFDPRGWFWSIKEKAEATIYRLKTGESPPDKNDKTPAAVSRIILCDQGKEFPVNYAKYGVFENIGTKNYRYVIKNPAGLSNAVGEGIYPNSTSYKLDPEFVKIKKDLSKLDHWLLFNSRDLKTAFYKWMIAPESKGVAQFYIAELLERSGLIEHAIKTYYSIIVHFPNTYAWTYWNTPWYPGKAAVYRIKYLIDRNPQLNLKLENTSIQIINGYDNDVRNDIFLVNPGRLVKISAYDKFVQRLISPVGKNKPAKKIISTKGAGSIKLLKYSDGNWQLSVNDEPFMVKGVTYAPTRVGESPDDGTLQNWTFQDLNKNGKIDGPYDAWVDANKNNIQDSDEKSIGDFQLMREMGVNTIRLYYQPFDLNKQLLRDMYKDYGIYVVLGNFLGKYTLGSNAPWEKGTDYDNLEHKKNMLASIKKMVEEYRDEPYILMWLIGNENVYGLGCNADKKPESFFKFANEAAKLIKELDPLQRPVAIASGDILYLDIFSRNCPDVDIFGSNMYRGKYGFMDLWNEVKITADKPAIITEYGAPAYGHGYILPEAEDYQADYLSAAWLDMMNNSMGKNSGTALGGFAFEWLDEWWKAYEPAFHDTVKLSVGPFLDGYYHEEWFGICGQGNGKNSPFLRQLRKSYYVFKDIWKTN